MPEDTGLDAAVERLPDLRAWRARALNGVMVALIVAGLPLIVLTLIEAVRHPVQWPAALAFLAVYVLLIVLAAFIRADFRLKVWIFLCLGYATAALTLARGGLAGGGRIFLLALPLLTLILVGLRASLIMAALSLLTYAAFAVTAHVGWMADWLVSPENPLELVDWVNEGVAFAMSLAGLMIIQWQISTFLTGLVAEKSRLHAESEELRAFNENIVQSMGEGILLEDTTGHIMFVNPSAAELLGTCPEDLIGQHWTNLVPPEHVAQVQEETDKRPRGIPGRYETVLLTQDGRRVPVMVSARPLFDGSRFNGVLSVLADITERKRAEEALRESEAMAQALLNATTESMLLADAQGTLLALNQTAAQRLGKRVEELVGSCATDLFPCALAESRRAMIDEVIRSGRPVRFEDEREGVAFDTSVYPVLDAQGRITRFAIFAQDVTARKRWEQYVIRTERLAAMGHLAAALTHEVSNPLQAIRSNLELVLDFDLEPDERRRYLDVIRQEIERLTAVTQRVLGLARPAGDTRCSVPIVDLMQKTLTLMAGQLHDAGIQVTTDFPTDLPDLVVAPDQIFQVLLNLTVNAIEAMPGGGYLHVAARTDGSAVQLSLTNGGPPLSEEHLEHIFDPFFTTKPDGTGLGLSISHSIVQQHGGTIAVQNLDGGRGVTFTLTLPIAPVVAGQEAIA